MDQYYDVELTSKQKHLLFKLLIIIVLIETKINNIASAQLATECQLSNVDNVSQDWIAQQIFQVTNVHVDYKNEGHLAGGFLRWKPNVETYTRA